MFHGSMVALVTPMQMDGSIDFDSLASLLEWHIDSGTDGIIAMGTTGEAATFSDSEKLSVIRFVLERVNGRIPVIAGTAAEGTEKATALTRAAADLGVDACLIMTPAYIKPTQQGLILHYQHIAKEVSIPIILYNVPSRTACDCLPETVAELAKVSNIVGIKEATGIIERVKKIRELCDDEIDIYSGDDGTAKDLMLAGGNGVISVTANVVPKQMKALCRAALSDKVAEAEKLDAELASLHRVLFVEANPIPTKWALHQMGKIPAGIRLPLTPLSEKYHQEVRSVLQGLDLV
ncbi:MAG: 4-hydroxy-tetrahydrodipicolinate synthase [Proteobacteria bacterium]|nr:4-hydroxy-tetrahydrodipicolinate synthase [Pseudomonadota bacterium]